MGFAAEFGLEVGLVGMAAHAGAGRIAALRHEAGNDAMEHHAIVKALLRIFDDAGDMAGRKVWTQLDDDIAAAVEGKGQGVVGHG